VKKDRDKGTKLLAQQNEQRRNAVMNLKGSLAAVREEVAAKASLYR
jgi:hypothetical protein